MERIRPNEVTLSKIQNLFNAEVEATLDADHLDFLMKREQLEKKYAQSFEDYVKHYDEIVAYGLDERLLGYLENFIVLLLELNKQEFMNTEFYQLFKEKSQVKRAWGEYQRRIKINTRGEHNGSI